MKSRQQNLFIALVGIALVASQSVYAAELARGFWAASNINGVSVAAKNYHVACAISL